MDIQADRLTPKKNFSNLQKPIKRGRNKGKNLKRRLKKKGRKHQRRRGKKFCCKKGIQSHLEVPKGLEAPACSQPDVSIIEKSLESFGFSPQMCRKIYETCCNDKIVGLET